MKKLDARSESLLESMRSGRVVKVRAITGEAETSSPGHGIEIVTRPLTKLVRAGLVEIDKIDKDAGWVYYKAREAK